jgi:hypothetical protein
MIVANSWLTVSSLAWTCLDHYSSQDSRGQAVTSCKLGALHHMRGRLPQAVHHLEHGFELARGAGDRRLQDVARMNLGVARAALSMEGYVQVRLRMGWDLYYEEGGCVQVKLGMGSNGIGVCAGEAGDGCSL